MTTIENFHFELDLNTCTTEDGAKFVQALFELGIIDTVDRYVTIVCNGYITEPVAAEEYSPPEGGYAELTGAEIDIAGNPPVNVEDVIPYLVVEQIEDSLFEAYDARANGWHHYS